MSFLCLLMSYVPMNLVSVFSLCYISDPSSTFLVKFEHCLSYLSDPSDFMLVYRCLVESFSTHGMRTIALLGASRCMTICLSQDQRMGVSKFGISSRMFVLCGKIGQTIFL
jgi:hypothetical protein